MSAMETETNMAVAVEAALQGAESVIKVNAGCCVLG